jgi:hypothetical protein
VKRFEASIREARRDRVRGQAGVNGIEYLEVSADQVTLTVMFLNPYAGPALTPDHVRVEGGTRVRDVRATLVTPLAGPRPGVKIQVERPGDFSTYTLRLVEPAQPSLPAPTFDPYLSYEPFSFKVGCPSDFDCRAPELEAGTSGGAPALDYLAKDYGAFRRLMLDRMALTAPEWRPLSALDPGVTLVELVAHMADQLSYAQDAIGTEAYLETARRRTSLARHARLVDYPVHEGLNARAFVAFEVNQQVTLPAGTRLLTRVPGWPLHVAESEELRLVAAEQGAQPFLTLEELTAWPAHGRMRLHTFGADALALPAGATEAFVVGNLPNLAPGDVVVLQEERGATGARADADPEHRHAVRLVEVQAGLRDELLNVDLTRVQWHDEDALPFELRLTTRDAQGAVVDAAVVRGNVALADHGLEVALSELSEVPTVRGARGKLRYRPAMAIEGLTYAAPLPYDPAARTAAPGAAAGPHPREISAGQSLAGDPQRGRPAVALTSSADGAVWLPQPDLLSSTGAQRHFVVEPEATQVYLRFGDGAYGRLADEGASYTVRARVGSGPAGNVGQDAVAHVVDGDPAVVAVSNPVPARGGRARASVEEIRRDAPVAFRAVQRRAVTEADYAAQVSAMPGVQRAAVRLVWTGSWHTVWITVDRLGGAPMDDAFEARVRAHLEPLRMAGHDLEVQGPEYVPLEVHLRVCVGREHFRADVKEALLEAFSAGRQPDGRLGFFHPDNFTFGQPVYLSQLHAAAARVAGVDGVVVEVFRRYRTESAEDAIAQGYLQVGPLQVARLDNDPSHPEHGILRVDVEGGR